MTQPQGYGPYQQQPPPGYRPLPPSLSPAGQPLADFGVRLLAYVIDMAILTAVAMALAIPVFLIAFYTMAPEVDPQTGGFAVGPFLLTFLFIELGFLLALLAAYYVYYVEMMYRSGQTVGKKAMKLRVVPIEPGATLTRGMAAKRYAVEFVGGMLIPFFSYLDGLWQLWDKPYLQTLHDKVAQTVVVKVPA